MFAMLYKCGHAILGGLFQLLIVEMSKHTIGRLRPYFYDACKPLCGDQFQDCCSKPILGTIHGEHTYVLNYTCNIVPPSSEKIVDRARVSFMSGHSSFSFYR